MRAFHTEVDNRELMLKALFENEIKSVTAYFDGSGDSGEINQLDVKSIDDEIEVNEITLDQIVLRGVKPSGESLNMGWVDGKYEQRDFEKQPLLLSELVQTVCYDVLELAHGGWEINAGSYGKIFIDVPLGGRYSSNAITIDYNEYEEDYEEYEGEEYNDE
jgi:hypothetical protein